MSSREKIENILNKLYDFLMYGTPMKVTRGFCLSIVTLSIIIFFSVFLYGTFYYIYIPQSTMRRQLHFQKAETVKERMDINGYKERVRLHMLHTEIPMTTTSSSTFLSPGQIYSIMLEIHMPDSDVNHHAGTFMINSNYYDKNEKLLTSSRRLVMIKYRSWLLRILDTLAFSPFYLIGFSEESQVRKIEIFSNYRESTFNPTTLITIDIDNPDVQLYEATLTVSINFTGLKYLMYHWPVTMAVVGISLISTIVLIVVCSSWLTLSSTTSSKHDDIRTHDDTSEIQKRDTVVGRSSKTYSEALHGRKQSNEYNDHDSDEFNSGLESSGLDTMSQLKVGRSHLRLSKHATDLDSLGVTDLDSVDSQHSLNIPTARQRKPTNNLDC